MRIISSRILRSRVLSSRQWPYTKAPCTNELNTNSSYVGEVQDFTTAVYSVHAVYSVQSLVYNAKSYLVESLSFQNWHLSLAPTVITM